MEEDRYMGPGLGLLEEALWLGAWGADARRDWTTEIPRKDPLSSRVTPFEEMS